MDLLVETLHHAMRTSVPPTITAIVTRTSPLTVSIQGVPVTVADACPQWPHETNDSVIVDTTSSPFRVVANTTRRPTRGTCTAQSAPTVTVTLAGGRAVTCSYVGTIPGVTKTVVVWWTVDGPVCAEQSIIPTAPGGSTPEPTSPPVPPPSSTGIIVARPTLVQTARGGAWRTDGRASTGAIQGHWNAPGSSTQDSTGYAMYGSQCAKPGATINGTPYISVYRPNLPIGPGGAATVHFRYHTAKTKPATPPPLTATATTGPALGRGARARFALPAAVGQDLLDGDILGVAVYFAGTVDYCFLSGPTGDNAWSDAFKLEIPWRS